MITYQFEPDLSPEAFIDVLNRSTLGERRPVDDPERIAHMLQHATLILTARAEGELVGVARSLTDFVYCTYLSDLAVDVSYQRQGIGIELIRRDYFLNAQLGVSSGKIADADTWPDKTAAVKGIEWLPRILPKVRAKLRGELPASMMYCCGGDRRFFKTNNIHPVEFLNLAWRHIDDDNAIIDWVAARASQK